MNALSTSLERVYQQTAIIRRSSLLYAVTNDCKQDGLFISNDRDIKLCERINHEQITLFYVNKELFLNGKIKIQQIL